MKINTQRKAMKEIVHDMGMKKGLKKGKKEGKEEGLKEGIKKGIKKGKEEMAKEIARNFKNKGVDIEIIVQSSGLSIKEIEAL
ncbi:MAG: hypothetical protein GY757_36110 [bacterium]|nr:hypothetical protein [bacterium]